MTTTLICEDVTARHEPGMDPTLRNISFSVDEGERVALVGLNGSGKTTLLLSIAGLVNHEGVISVCGERLTRKSAAGIRARIGFLFNVPEDQLLFPKVIEDVAFGLARSGASREEAAERAGAMLEKMGIAGLCYLPLHHLSHGQKQRVALAGAFVSNPPLLLLDEPSSGLDPPGRLELAKILRSNRSAQLIATHDLEFASRVCSRTILLENGTIAGGASSPAEIEKRWASD